MIGIFIGIGAFFFLVLVQVGRDYLDRKEAKKNHQRWDPKSLSYYILMAVADVVIGILTGAITNFLLAPPNDKTDQLKYSNTAQSALQEEGPRNVYETVMPYIRSLTDIRFGTGSFTKNQRLSVYSAPSESSWYEKTSEGKPVYASTNDVVYVAGYVNGWMLIRYQTGNSKNPGPDRIGYTKGNQGRSLNLNNYSGRITENCYLSDGASNIVYLKTGTTVTVLGKMDTGIYVESYASDGRTARGIVPERAVEW